MGVERYSVGYQGQPHAGVTSRKGVNKTEAGSEDGDTRTKRGMGLDPIRNFGALLEIRTVFTDMNYCHIYRSE